MLFFSHTLVSPHLWASLTNRKILLTAIFGANGASDIGYCSIYVKIYKHHINIQTVTINTSPISPRIRSGTFTKQHHLLYIVVGEVIFSPVDEKIFSEQLCVYYTPNRFLVHTLQNSLCCRCCSSFRLLCIQGLYMYCVFIYRIVTRNTCNICNKRIKQHLVIHLFSFFIYVARCSKLKR